METTDRVLIRVPRAYRVYAVLTACIALQFVNGLGFTFGNWLPYVTSYMHHKGEQYTHESLLWLQCLMVSFPFSHLAASHLERRLGARMTTFVGSVMYTVSVLLFYFALRRAALSLMLFVAVCMGVGSGVSSSASLIIAQRWMPGRERLASGLVLAGGALGAVFLPLLQTLFVNAANAPIRKPFSEKVNYRRLDALFAQPTLGERVPEMFALMAALFLLLQAVALFFLGKPTAEKDDAAKIVAPPPAMTKRVVDAEAALKSQTFACLAVTFLLNSFGAQMISALYKAYALPTLNDDLFLCAVISLAAVANCVGRGAFVALAARLGYSRPLAFASLVGSIVMWIFGFMHKIDNRIVLLLTVFVMFVSAGGTSALIPYGIHSSFGAINFTILYGYAEIAMFLGNLLTAAGASLLVPAIGIYHFFPLAGLAMTVSVFIAALLPLTDHYYGMRMATDVAVTKGGGLTIDDGISANSDADTVVVVRSYSRKKRLYANDDSASSGGGAPSEDSYSSGAENTSDGGGNRRYCSIL